MISALVVVVLRGEIVFIVVEAVVGSGTGASNTRTNSCIPSSHHMLTLSRRNHMPKSTSTRDGNGSRRSCLGGISTNTDGT